MNSSSFSPASSFWEKALPSYLPTRRWFGGKARVIAGTVVLDRFPLSPEAGEASIFVIEVRYDRGPPEIYLLPAREWRSPKDGGGEQIGVSGWHECLNHGSLWRTLLEITVKGETLRGERGGALVGNPGKLPPRQSLRRFLTLPWRLGGAEQSNSSVTFGNMFFFKLYRKLEEGINPEVEMLKALTDQGIFHQIAPFRGAIEYRSGGAQPSSAGLLLQRVPPYGAGDYWGWALISLVLFFRRADRREGGEANLPELPSELETIPADLAAVLPGIMGKKLVCGPLLLLGSRTAEMHLALESLRDNPDFSPEPLLVSDLQTIPRAAEAAGEAIRGSRRRGEVTAGNARLAEEARDAIRASLDSLSRSTSLGKKIRIHGDYHLGQVLITPKDLVVIDFEGEPARLVAERRAKQSPLRDVAGMLRSFHYASQASRIITYDARHGALPPESEAWADFWCRAASRLFLDSYLKRLGEKSSLLPSSPKATRELLKIFLLEKALYELAYELNNRPDWAAIPLRGILSLLKADKGDGS